MSPSFQNISVALRYYARQTPEKTYLVSGDSTFSYKTIDHLIDSVCSFYESLHLKSGQIISAIIQNSVEYVLFYLASLRYGCVFNPYPYNLEARDIARYLSFIQPTLLLCQESHYDGFKKAHNSIYKIPNDFLSSLPNNVRPYPDFVPKESSPACIYYSSGTTGNPKGIVFSHRNMLANISSVAEGFGFDDNTTHLVILPLGHTASINYSFLPATVVGGSLVIAESFWKIRMKFWEYIKKYHIGYVETVPSILVALLNTPYPTEEWKKINSLSYIGCGSSTLPKELQRSIEEKFGFKVANLYGLSETGPTHFDNPLEEGWEPGSVGKPLGVNEVAIMDSEDHVLSSNEIGEIVIKGPNVFIGYYENENLYNTVVKNGYFHTGDLGYMAGDGTLYFTGRLKDLIIKGGVNISPDEIDEVLFKMPCVAEALTVGIPDKYLGEKIMSFVVLKEGMQASESEVLDFCKQYLSRDKLPNQITFTSSLPKGPSGKLLRRKIKEELRDSAQVYSHELEVARNTAYAMGKIQLSCFRKPLRVIRKAPKEFVSHVDLECHGLANKMLSSAFPYPVISEEIRDGCSIGDERTWVVDPIDGTHNFIAGQTYFGISIALIDKKQFVLGVIYLPYFDEIFYAIKGQGAFMNGRPIHVSNNNQLEKSIVAYDNQFHLDHGSFDRYKKVAEHSFTTRIFGSAVFDFCSIALGRIDARIWNHTKLYDYAAGAIIVREAGGRVTNFENDELPLHSTRVIASNGAVHDRIRLILSGS